MTEGLKLDTEKDRWDLLPIKAVRGIVQVLTFGARKYAPDNWKHVPDARRRYYAAALRHMAAWWEGEQVDQESGLPHLAHAGCCLLFLASLPITDVIVSKGCPNCMHHVVTRNGVEVPCETTSQT